MQLGHCMSYREESGRLYMVGSCPYANQRDGVADDDGYVALPDNVSELSFYQCCPLNRTGPILCFIWIWIILDFNQCAHSRWQFLA